MRLYTTEEVMASAVSRELVDGDVCFIGLGTGGRAFTYAVGIPSVGVALAQGRGVDVVAQYGVMVDAVIEEVPMEPSDPLLLGWRCRALVPVEAGLDAFRNGRIHWGFVSAAQVDRYGNLNSVCIGAHSRPDVRLVGPIAQPDHSAYARRTMVIVPHERRVLVERVDFVSGFGYGRGHDDRNRYGLPGGGPARVVTDLAVLEFNDTTKCIQIRSLHPGVEPDHVTARTGFALQVPPDVPRTVPPSEEDVWEIRTRIDPRGVWLREGIAPVPPS